MTLKLSVLDQSPVINGHSPAEALRRTVELARETDAMGFQRYWLAEHHSTRALADPCPEILLTAVASATTRIRVGTGGVLLPYYSPLKVAEVFRMLEALFPGRVDLGIGRAPGSDGLTARALSGGAFYDFDQFPAHVQETVSFLDDALPPDHPYARVKAMPSGEGAPEVWLLGSSDYSATLAAYLGLRFSFAHFINAFGGEEVTKAYRNGFRPSRRERTARSMVAVFAICGATDREAERLASSIDLRRLQMARGLDEPVATMEEALARTYTAEEEAIIHRERPRAIIGTADRVLDRIREVALAFDADEVMVLTITGDYASRLKSYERLASAADL